MDILKKTPLFQGIPQEELPMLLRELDARRQRFKKGEFLLREGQYLEKIGIVLEGMVLLQCTDVWGNNSILGSAAAGAVFGEAYACVPDQRLMISAQAAENSEVLWLRVRRILESRERHLTESLLTVCAQKNLQLSHRIIFTASKSLRGRLMSYFSQCVRQSGSLSFTVPYNRQQLADYLSVDRSAMCSELSKMQRDGLIRYEKNAFTVLQTPERL